ncbi:T9SS type A sorting domain-containing protein [Hanstruepera ponticola]|uniref:T9SS type A sorting domain-containing protein n=1 Tax=Hanstruepera ponticola TaxID=2042995 RepID=UPI000CF10A99|nr:T9SS type A sorting domain-containing protein [Hanstruepera ponticola]
MKKLYFLLFTLISFAAFSQTTVFINELHYDNAGGDVDEAVEIAGPAGTDLTGWTIEAYNGSNGALYDTFNLSGTIADQQAGYGTLNFLTASLQNGSPDAIALVDDGGTVIQFLSYEGELTATDGTANGMTSTDIGVAETSSTPIGHSLQLTGTGDTYEEFTWAPAQANTYGAVNTGQTFTAANTPSISITSPTDGAFFPPGTTMVTLSINVQNFVVDELPGNGGTGDGHIHWTIDSGSGDVAQPMKYDTDDEIIAVTNGGSYFITMNLVDNSHQPIGVSTTVIFDVLAPTPVANIAALRTEIETNGTGGYYELQNTPTVTFVRDASNRNQKYIQDDSAAILIDDSAGTITNSFSIGDGMSGLVGQSSSFGGVLQFVPTVNPAVVAGSTITPQVVTIATLLNDWEPYESQIVQINDAFFTDAGSTFVEDQDYLINDTSSLQGGSSMTFRTAFDATEVDYIGETIPAGNNNMIVIVSEFGATPQVTARSLNELTLTVDNFETSEFNVYPNPVTSGYVNITSSNSNDMSVAIYDVLGKRVVNTNVINNRVNVSSLNTGIYILQISQNGKSITKKLVVK